MHSNEPQWIELRNVKIHVFDHRAANTSSWPFRIFTFFIMYISNLLSYPKWCYNCCRFTIILMILRLMHLFFLLFYLLMMFFILIRFACPRSIWLSTLRLWSETFIIFHILRIFLLFQCFCFAAFIVITHFQSFLFSSLSSELSLLCYLSMGQVLYISIKFTIFFNCFKQVIKCLFQITIYMFFKESFRFIKVLLCV